MFYLDLFQTLERHKVRYLVIGGLAVVIHGVDRLTMDVDIMLSFDSNNLRGFFSAAEEMELKPVLPVALHELADNKMVKSWVEQKNMVAFALRAPQKNAPTIDILIRPSVPFDEAYARRIEKVAGNTKISVASIEDIIRMKSATGRSRDKSDIEALQHILSGTRK